jgi:enolase 1/2/3
LARSSKVIAKVRARQVLDSRGNPTVESEVRAGNVTGRASVPSGASTGVHEALELRDADARRFHGKGVEKAVSNVNSLIGPRLVRTRVADQLKLDKIMLKLDGTPNKSRLGANAILAVSMSCARTAALTNGVPLFTQLRKRKAYRLPVPMMNVINGGEHAGNDLAIQEFLIEPVGADSCSEAIRMGAEVYQSLKGILVSKYGRGAINVGDEGGFAPPLGRTSDALKAIMDAIKSAGYGEKDVRIGIDAAASTFYDKASSAYTLDGKSFSPDSLADYYNSMVEEFDLLTVEDPFEEEAFGDFASFTKRVSGRTIVIGDDIYVTNVDRIKRGIEEHATNGVLIKLNQIGTVSETEDAIGMTMKVGWTPVISHRSGETEDPFISHLATAFEAPFIKAGAPARGERIAKYNELLRIEETLGRDAKFAGAMFRR